MQTIGKMGVNSIQLPNWLSDNIKPFLEKYDFQIIDSYTYEMKVERTGWATVSTILWTYPDVIPAKELKEKLIGIFGPEKDFDFIKKHFRVFGSYSTQEELFALLARYNLDVIRRLTARQEKYVKMRKSGKW